MIMQLLRYGARPRIGFCLTDERVPRASGRGLEASKKVEMMQQHLRSRLVRANHRLLKRILTLVEILGTRELSAKSVAQALGWGQASVYRYLDVVRALGGRPQKRLVNGEVWYSMPPSNQVRSSLVRVALESIDGRLGFYLAGARRPEAVYNGRCMDK